MIKWIPFAMVRVAIFFIAGILVGIYLPNLIPLNQAIITLAGISVLYFVAFALLKRYRSTMLGSLGLLAIFFMGYVHLLTQTESREENHLLKEHDTITAYQGVVRSYPESKSKSWKVELEVSHIKTDHWKPAKGRVQLYISKKENTITWRYGDAMIIRGSPQILSPPANPSEFDFRRFLTFRNIHHQHFLKKGDFEIVAPTSAYGPIYYSHQAREWSSRKIETFIAGEEQQAIAMALILGVTDGIDTDLQNAYSASGAMHVLAVSGLHVGIIYAMILFLLRPLKSRAWSRWFVAAISLLALWAFAFVTGLSPSVLRAVTMFSFVAIARPFGVRTNIYNTLAASAFVLLLYNPYLIMSVGFQLSYLAVIGIVYLQKPIYRSWDIQNRVGDWVWEITCISIAAQLTTFSLGLLYFHQFPVYFLVSNLFVIPLSIVILILGIVLLVVSPFSFLANGLGWFIGILIKILNWIVFKVEELPFSLINNIQMTTFQCWLIMGILGALILLIEVRSIRWLITSLLLAIVFSLTQWFHFYEFVDQSHAIVYSVSNHTAIDFIDRGNANFLADSALANDQERIRFHIRPNRLESGVAFINQQDTKSITRNGITFFHWKDKLFGIARAKKVKLPLNGFVDYLIISQNSLPSLNGNETVRIGQLIVDGSNSRWVAQQWKTWAAQRNIPIHSVLTENSFVINYK